MWITDRTVPGLISPPSPLPLLYLYAHGTILRWSIVLDNVLGRGWPKILDRIADDMRLQAV